MAVAWIRRMLRKPIRSVSRSRRKHPPRRRSVPALEPLGERILPSVTAVFVPAGRVLCILGDAGNNTITVSRNTAGKLLVNGGAVAIRGGAPTVAGTAIISVSGLGGNDAITLDESNGPLPRGILFGGAGDDTLTGGSGADELSGQSGNDTLVGKGGKDLLFGGDGNDLITGGTGNDTVFLGAGDDTFAWNAGDSGDTVEGQGGHDRLILAGSSTPENINVSASGSRVRVSRSSGGVMDLGGVEQVDVNAPGGADPLTVNDLTGTDLTLVNLNLPAGTRGGLANTVLVSGTGGGDLVSVRGTAGNVLVSGLHAFVRITGSEGDRDQLIVKGLGGDDDLNASTLQAGVIRLILDGGAGNDTLVGSRGDDTLLGGDGNDFVEPFQGNDVAEMGAGNDTFEWDPGDGSDVIDGQDGSDTMIFNGSDDREDFDLFPVGNRVHFIRDLGTIVMDLGGVEEVDVNPLGGSDVVDIDDLSATDLKVVNVNLQSSEETGDGQPDAVVVSATSANDNITITSANNGSRIVVSGLVPLVNITGAEGANDHLRINAGAGNDTVNASGLPAGEILLNVNGGAGDDLLIGSGGGDLVNGGSGNDRVFLGAGDDTFTWKPGDGSDTVEGQDGHDSLVFNGFNDGENIALSANGSRLRLVRDVDNVLMDVNGVEQVDVNPIAGNDTITVNDLSATGVTEVNLDLAGSPGSGGGDGEADTVVVNGTEGEDALTVAGDAGGVSVMGLSALVSIQAAEANDHLTINALGGNDVVDASGVRAGAIPLTINGGAGDDTLMGGPGQVTLDGGPGNNVLIP